MCRAAYCTAEYPAFQCWLYKGPTTLGTPWLVASSTTVAGELYLVVENYEVRVRRSSWRFDDRVQATESSEGIILWPLSGFSLPSQDQQKKCHSESFGG